MIVTLFLIGLVGAIPLAPNDCPAITGSPKYAAPIVGKGFTARVVVNGLTRPRSIVFDKEGNMLVLQNRVEITGFNMKNDNGCVKATGKTTVVKAAVVPGDNVSHHQRATSRY
jgi:hypothetical protein